MVELDDNSLLRITGATFAPSLIALFVSLPSVSRLSPDAWTVYELAGTIGHGFFRANTVREYVTGSASSSAFAPLWPTIVALFALPTGNIYGGYVAAFVSYAAFGIAAELFARRAFGMRTVGLLSTLLMLRFVFVGADVVSRYKFGALTGWRVLPIPSNWERLGRVEQDEFLRRYQASYVVDARPASSRPISRRDTPLECPLPLRKLASAVP
jgi:hypothetical protein